MPEFSEQSDQRLRTCDARIQRVFRRVIRAYDCTILEGWRSAQRQAELMSQGVTRTLNSKHLSEPALAVDVAPWPIPDNWGEPGDDGAWSEVELKARCEFYHFAGFVQAIAEVEGVPLRWGGDWDADRDFLDQKFDDLVHFEISER